jgi:release factor glutamine methyltransferase
MTIHEGQKKLLTQLYHLYDDREAGAIANLIMENITGLKKIDRVINKLMQLSEVQISLLTTYSAELDTHKPVQYVLHEAWFCDMKFYVDEHVLIPRHETEELVAWIQQEVMVLPAGEAGTGSAEKNDGKPAPDHQTLTVLDIGTGSGSIAIALKKKLDDPLVFSCDVSETALSIARQNALSNHAEVNFLCLDFLDPEKRKSLPSCHLIVSNPPYIPVKDKSYMPANVVNFEPHLALFVSDHDPLVFYKAIAEFSTQKLLPGGTIYVEVHEDLFSHVKKLFLLAGFANVEVRKDMQNKSRMVKATMLL